jgi:hypothetical protein
VKSPFPPALTATERRESGGIRSSFLSSQLVRLDTFFGSPGKNAVVEALHFRHSAAVIFLTNKSKTKPFTRTRESGRCDANSNTNKAL